MKTTSWQRLGLSHLLKCSGERPLFGVFHQVLTPPLIPQNGKSDSKLLVNTQPKISCYVDVSEKIVSACKFLLDIRTFLMLFFIRSNTSFFMMSSPAPILPRMDKWRKPAAKIKLNFITKWVKSSRMLTVSILVVLWIKPRKAAELWELLSPPAVLRSRNILPTVLRAQL